jgi:2-polyprenyl-3-methyl-5-hydroxy-6-metoxy-1,4-benzoquinol methylase
MSTKPQEEDTSPFWGTYDQHYRRLGNVQPSLDAIGHSTAKRQLEAAWLPQDMNAAILDIGCGWGNLLLSLWAAGRRNLYGVDISRPMYDLAVHSLPEGIKLACADSVDYLKENIGRFDLITIFDVIEHMPVERAITLLQGCKDALRPSGRVVIRTPNMANLLAQYILYSDVTHVQGYSEWSLYQLLDLAGFSSHRVIVENRSGPASWASQLSLRHPLAGLNIERLLGITLHRALFAIHPQIPKPTVYDFNIVVLSNKPNQACA